MQFTPGAQIRSASMLSPDRRGGHLTGPALPAAGTSAWVSAAPSSGVARGAPPPAVSYEPAAGAVQRDGHHSPPPFTQQAQQAMLAQQAYMALGQTAEVPATARPQWRDPSGRQGPAPAPAPQQWSAASAHSLHAPVAGGSASLAPGPQPGPRGCSAVVPVPPRAADEGATARFTAPPCPTALGSGPMHQPQRVMVECRRQQSIGGCSGTSMPSNSPTTAPREPKASIEVPLIVMDRQALDQEPLEGFKQSEDMKVVKVSDIVSLFKETEKERIEDLKRENEMHRHDAQRAKEAEQRAQESASSTAAQLADKVREFSEVESQLRQTEQRLEEETAAHERTRQTAEEAQRSAHHLEEAHKAAHERELDLQDEQRAAQSRSQQLQEQLEEVQRKMQKMEDQIRETQQAAQKWEELFREADMARSSGEDEKARELIHLQAKIKDKDDTIAELESKLKRAHEECNSYKVRHSYLELQMDQKTSEHADLRTQAATTGPMQVHTLITCCCKMERPRFCISGGTCSRERCSRAERASREAERAAREAEQRACEAEQLALEKEKLQARLEDLGGRRQDLEAERHALQEQQREREHGFGTREAALARREEALAQAERQAAEGLGRQREAAERELQQHRERVRELERQAAEQQGDRQRRCTDSERENRSLKQTVQEQKQMLFSLQSQLHREQAVANFITPGELLKMVKKEAAETSVHDNADLLLKLHNLEAEVREVRWHNEVMRQKLPRSAWEGVAKELAQPLPVRGVALEPRS